MKSSYVIVLAFFLACENKAKRPDTLAEKTKSHLSSQNEFNRGDIPSSATGEDSIQDGNSFEEVGIKNGYIQYHFDFDGFSNEGGEGFAYYQRQSKKIKKVEITLFGERAQTNIQFDFSNNVIKAKETTYRYDLPITEVQSRSDMTKDREIEYVIDFQGRPIGNIDSDRVDVFQNLRKIVPFALRY